MEQLIDEATLKKFSFSYSAIKNFETCPRRYYETSVVWPRVWIDPPSPQIKEGYVVHDALAHALRTGEPLPSPHDRHQTWVDKVKAVPGDLLVEQRLAITRDFEPTFYKNDKAWFRVIIDAAKISSDYGLAIDWKTGRSENVGDNLQLTLTALTLFIHYPDIRIVGCRYVWLKEKQQTKHQVKYEQIGEEWEKIMPRVAELERAHREKDFPPKPNRFCRKYCPVKSCSYWGK